MTDHLTKTLASLVRRYRHELPLGNQPHMIAQDADEALALFDAAQQAALCDCGKKLASECEKWEPGCHLGTEAAHAEVKQIAPAFLATLPVGHTATIEQAAGEQALPPLPDGRLDEVQRLAEFASAAMHGDPKDMRNNLEDIADRLCALHTALAQQPPPGSMVTEAMTTLRRILGAGLAPVKDEYLRAAVHAVLRNARAAQAAQPLPAHIDALQSIRRACETLPSAIARAIVATCDNGLAAQPLPVRDEREAPAAVAFSDKVVSTFLSINGPAPNGVMDSLRLAAAHEFAALTQPAPEAAKGSEAVHVRVLREFLASLPADLGGTRRTELRGTVQRMLDEGWFATPPAPEAQRAEAARRLAQASAAKLRDEIRRIESALLNAGVLIERNGESYGVKFSGNRAEPQQPAQAVPLTPEQAEQWLEANCGPRTRWTVEDVWYEITPAQLVKAAHGISVKEQQS